LSSSKVVIKDPRTAFLEKRKKLSGATYIQWNEGMGRTSDFTWAMVFSGHWWTVVAVCIGGSVLYQCLNQSQAIVVALCLLNSTRRSYCYGHLDAGGSRFQIGLLFWSSLVFCSLLPVVIFAIPQFCYPVSVAPVHGLALVNTFHLHVNGMKMFPYFPRWYANI
jgi:hypothetical protein